MSEYEEVSGGNIKKTAQMKIGETFIGTLKALEESKKYAGRQNLIMVGEDGTEFLVFTSGSLSYAVKDGKLEVGQTYRITRTENTPTKQGGTRTNFKIERKKSDGSMAGAPSEKSAKPSGSKK